MKILIDTHILLWAIFDPSKLSKKESAIIKNPENIILVSAASLWEISLKYSKGQLNLVRCIPTALPSILVEDGFELIDLTPQETAGSFILPKTTHSDPFDRMIIWQAIFRQIPLLTRDEKLKEYTNYGLQLAF